MTQIKPAFFRSLLFTLPLLLLSAHSAKAQETEKASEENWRWYSAEEMEIRGRGWEDTSSPFTRFPARAKEVVRPPVWNLSLDSAGLYIEFKTDAPSIRARWSPLKERLAMAHMPATGVSGIDLYVRHKRDWRFLAVGQPTKFPDNETTFFRNLPQESREYRLYFPLYNGLKSLEIGVPNGFSIEPLPASDRKPVVFYGTSILQGGCASRPGMAYPSIIGRRIDSPVINLGFSGNGRGEPEVADLVAEIDPALFVLDPLPNISPDDVTERLENFVKTIRARYPETPILLVESVVYTNGFLIESRRNRYEQSNAHLKNLFDRLRKSGDRNIYYHKSENLLGKDGEDTVDGTHPTDLGFLRMADGLTPVVREILAGTRDQVQKPLRHFRTQNRGTLH